MAEPLRGLPSELWGFLQEPRIVQVTTLDSETGDPTVTIMSWVLATESGTLRVVADAKARSIQQLKADPRVAITVLGAGHAWAIYGTARVLSERVPYVALRLAMAEVSDLRIYPSMFWGAVLTRAPEWDVTYSREQSAKMDQQVFAAMRNYVPEVAAGD